MAYNSATIYQYEEKTEYIKIYSMSGTNALTDQHICHAYTIASLHPPLKIYKANVYNVYIQYKIAISTLNLHISKNLKFIRCV